MLEVDAYEVNLLAPDRCGGLELLLLFGLNGLVLEGFRLLVVEDLLGVRRERLTRILELVVRLYREAELLSPMAPVEHMGLLGRIIPVDEGLSPFCRREL